ncbi:MAG: hypothetical protein MUE44_22925 [Oscillatoriaceae cyanobacterium Prado104]|nr:hypothetical protein [Oscillatoriaceae cyanobacterium Prado104]
MKIERHRLKYSRLQVYEVHPRNPVSSKLPGFSVPHIPENCCISTEVPSNGRQFTGLLFSLFTLLGIFILTLPIGNFAETATNLITA